MSQEGGLFELAEREGLEYKRAGQLPASVPLLGQSERIFDHIVHGPLPSGREANLAHYTYLTRHKNRTRRHRFTVLLTAVPESAPFVSRLSLHSGGASAGGMILDPGSGLEIGMRPVALESAVMAERWALQVGADTDDSWVRQLFSPRFIDWLISEAPQELSFELENGALCVYLPEHTDSPEDLDALRRAAERIATRLRDEAHEEAGQLQDASPAELERAAEVDAELAKVSFGRPPESATEAARAFRARARRSRAPIATGAATAAGAAPISMLVVWGFEPAGLALGVGTGLALGGVAFDGAARSRASTLGEAAFLREYARTRGLEEETPQSFGARHLGLPLPGVVTAALHGTLPRTVLEGSLLLLEDRSDRRKPVKRNATVVAVDDAAAAPPDATANLRVDRGGGFVCVSAPAGKERTAAQLDGVCASAAAVLGSGSTDTAS